MRLTKADIDDAVHMIECARDLPAFNRHDSGFDVLLAALAGYERVTAWSESGALDAVITSRALPPEVRLVVKGCRD